MVDPRTPSPGVVALSLLGFSVFWSVLAWLRGDPSILPPPNKVAAKIASEWASGELMYHVSATLGRVVAAFGLAMMFGTIIGIAMGKSAGLERPRWLL